MRRTSHWFVALIAAPISLIASSNRLEAAPYLGNAVLSQTVAYGAGWGRNRGCAYGQCGPVVGCAGEGEPILCSSAGLCCWKPGSKLRLFGHHKPNDTGEGSWYNCSCKGSYKFPVPPLYTYHWAGMYADPLMTDYQSPWRFPAVTPFSDAHRISDTHRKSFDDRNNRYPDDDTDSYREGRIRHDSPRIKFDHSVSHVRAHQQEESINGYSNLMSNVMTKIYSE